MQKRNLIHDNDVRVNDDITLKGYVIREHYVRANETTHKLRYPARRTKKCCERIESDPIDR